MTTDSGGAAVSSSPSMVVMRVMRLRLPDGSTTTVVALPEHARRDLAGVAPEVVVLVGSGAG